jgi:pimeloyl-ACP methyl ester carboxylesterase
MRASNLIQASVCVALAMSYSPTIGVSLRDAAMGCWAGDIVREGKRLGLNVELAEQSDALAARVDVPDLYVEKYQASNVTMHGSDLRFELASGGDPHRPDRFEGVVNGDRITGQYAGGFSRMDGTSEFRLRRVRCEVASYTTEEVRFINGEVTLAGTLRMPSTPGHHSAVVLLHGSGPQTRESYLSYFASLFARQNVATLIFDKRGTGASTGVPWYRTGDHFDVLAEDALAGVKYLRNRPDVAAARIGLWGLSQGGWLVPLAASQSDDVSFVMVVSGGGVSPAEQEIYDDQVKLVDAGFSPSDVTDAVELLRLADDVIRGRASWEAFAESRARAERKPWFPLLDRYPAKLPKEDDTWRSGSTGMDLDPRSLWQRLHIPVLAIFGQDDKSTPAAESALRMGAALRAGGNVDFTIRTFPNADHGLWVTPRKNERWDWDRPARGWIALSTSWLRKHVR